MFRPSSPSRALQLRWRRTLRRRHGGPGARRPAREPQWLDRLGFWDWLGTRPREAERPTPPPEPAPAPPRRIARRM